MRLPRFEAPHFEFTESADGRPEQGRASKTVPASGANYVAPVIPPPEPGPIVSATISGATATELTYVEYELSYTEGVTIDVEWRIYFNEGDGGGVL